MSMTSALNNALSGLNAVGRSAQAVSDNIANALTPGYGRREVAQSSGALGGVQIDGITRSVNAAILSDRRMADAIVAGGGAAAGFLDRMQSLLGAPDDGASLTGRLATLEGRLLEAASRPDSTTRLTSVVDGANALVGRINAIGQGIQTARAEADAGIASDVDLLNTTLTQVRDLNASIARMATGNGDSSALKDQRQVLIDQISEIVPVRQIARDRDVVALITTGGQVILDSQAVTFDFTRANAVTPGMTLANGLLSGLTLDGRPIDMNTDAGRMDGGRLAGSFAVRDTLAPDAQADIDGFARDLIARFQDSAVDATRAPGDAGLFTDAGAVMGAAPDPGLAQRIALNASVDPAEGGAVTRLRDGLGAAVAGPVGNAVLLQALGDTLTAQAPTSLGVSTSVAGFAGELMSQNSGALFRADQSQTFAQARADALREQELAGGVDTDQEMQKLLLIEQSYGANARVIQVIDAMMRRLLEI